MPCFLITSFFGKKTLVQFTYLSWNKVLIVNISFEIERNYVSVFRVPDHRLNSFLKSSCLFYTTNITLHVQKTIIYYIAKSQAICSVAYNTEKAFSLNDMSCDVNLEISSQTRQQHSFIFYYFLSWNPSLHCLAISIWKKCSFDIRIFTTTWITSMAFMLHYFLLIC